MADGTRIEWTDATWNPITGCSVVSPGCTNCYAMKLAGGRQRHHPSRKGLTMATKSGPVWNGEVRFNEGWLDQPIRWTRPRRIFVCAHGDLFHPAVPDVWIDAVFAVMAMAPQHQFQVLTKRPERMRKYIGGRPAHRSDSAERIGYQILSRMGEEGVSYPAYWSVTASALIHGPTPNIAAGIFPRPDLWPLPNVWLGVSVEDQARVDERIPILLDTPAAVRWVSAEPLLGPVRIDDIDVDGRNGTKGFYQINALTGRNTDMARPCDDVPSLDWVVVGGESGPAARPMHPDWARALRDQCQAAGVAFMFKQWGSWLPWEPEHGPCWKAQNGRAEDRHTLFPADLDQAPNWDDGLWALPQETHFAFQRVGKKTAGRRLDGEIWDEYPA